MVGATLPSARRKRSFAVLAEWLPFRHLSDPGVLPRQRTFERRPKTDPQDHDQDLYRSKLE
jgi:hypothetical protein